MIFALVCNLLGPLFPSVHQHCCCCCCSVCCVLGKMKKHDVIIYIAVVMLLLLLVLSLFCMGELVGHRCRPFDLFYSHFHSHSHSCPCICLVCIMCLFFLSVSFRCKFKFQTRRRSSKRSVIEMKTFSERTSRSVASFYRSIIVQQFKSPVNVMLFLVYGWICSFVCCYAVQILLAVFFRKFYRK